MFPYLLLPLSPPFTLSQLCTLLPSVRRAPLELFYDFCPLLSAGARKFQGMCRTAASLEVMRASSRKQDHPGVMFINKAKYSASDASRRRLREGVTDLQTDGPTDGPTDGQTLL